MPPQPRAAVQALHAYVPPLEGRRQKIRLDFNENTVGFADHFPEVEPTHLLAYPEYADLITRLAQLLKLPENRLLITNGSDEGLFVAAFTFLENGDQALVNSPTFALIPHYLRLCGANLKEVPVQDNLEPDLDEIESWLPNTKMAMFASPDNPTGGTLPLARLKQWLHQFPDTAFVLDEAYFEYHGQTALPWLENDPPLNLIISRTFSKAWGLAGLRLGLLAAHEQTIEWMKRVRSPYSVNAVAAKSLLRFLPHAHKVQEQAEAAMQRKAHTLQQLSQRGWQTHPGAANFFLLWAGPFAKLLSHYLAEHGILTRDRSSLYKMGGSIRISVGSAEENQKLLQTIDDFQQTHALLFDLDDTLVDTSRSYDAAVEQLTGCTHQELQNLRAEGGFNDDWTAAHELLKRNSRPQPLEQVIASGKAIYAQLAPTQETPYFQEEWLQSWRQRHRTFIFTGRPRDEYESIWGERLKPHFDDVLCLGEHGLPGKPAPDGLHHLMQKHSLKGGIYVGNSVDDMRAAKAAGLLAVGVTTNQSAETLKQAGADLTLPDLRAFHYLLSR